MNKIFAFCNQKGGVGKTTTTLNLGTALAIMGHRSLIIDADPQANTTSGIGVDVTSIKNSIYNIITGECEAVQAVVKTSVDQLFIIPANQDLIGAEVELASAIGREFVLREACSGLKDEFDFILIDCPPSLGLLTLNALVLSDAIVIPLQCEYYALEGLSQLMRTFQLVKERLNRKLEIGGVILTMADFRTNLTQQVIDDVRKHFTNNVLQSVIPRSVKISEAPSFGKPVVIYDPSSKGAQAYFNAAREFSERNASSERKVTPKTDFSKSAEEISPVSKSESLESMQSTGSDSVKVGEERGEENAVSR